MAEIDDDQCDLEALAAILDDDHDEEQDEREIEEGKPPNLQQHDDDEELCFSDSDDEEGLAALASVMEKENEVPPRNSSKVQDIVGMGVRDSPKETGDETLEVPADTQTAKLQERLRQMEEEMLKLRKQVQQQPVPPSKSTSRLSGEALNMCPAKQETSPTSKQKPSPSQLTIAPAHKFHNHNGPSFEEDISPKEKPKKTVVEISSVSKQSDKKNTGFLPDSDSDSDWEDMDGEKATGLSKQGKELHKILKGGQRKRTAHTSTYSPSVFKKQLPEAKWKSKTDVSQPTTEHKSSAVSLASKFVKENEDVMVFAGIRIIYPKVQSEILRVKMEGRKMMKMSRLSFKLNTSDLEGNWVTFGVLVHKSDTRKSSNGNNYSIWKLSDLEDVDKTMTFFLFRDVHKHHWKCQLGTVLGLLNPNLMQKAEKFQSENSFTIEHPGQMLIIGQSKDLGSCKGTTKSGKVCNNVINKRQSEYCSFHVQSVYKKASAKRTDLQSGFSGVVPKAYSKKIIPTGSHVFYGGQTFSTLQTGAKPSNKKGVSLKQLQQHNSAAQSKVTTLSLHDLSPPSADKKDTPGIKEQPFLDFLSTPTVGSLNLVKHLIKQENRSEKEPGKVQMVSVSPAQLLKQHKQQANQLKQKQAAKSGNAAKTNGVVVPQLGRGFQPGQDIVFGSPKTFVSRDAELPKKLAIAKVLAKGGITKEDPNAVRKSKTSAQSQERVRKRVADHLEAESEETVTQPPPKRSRYLGNVDLNSEEVQKLLKAKSSHSGALAQLQAEREEKYFGELEKKEKCEQQMLSITEIKCTAYTCKQCKYTALSTSDLCKAEGHKVSQIKAMKRFFKCQDCNTRTLSLHRYPTLPCRSCKGKSFIKTSMWKEKEGPKLESEVLHITGDAQKYLDSQMK